MRHINSNYCINVVIVVLFYLLCKSVVVSAFALQQSDELVHFPVKTATAGGDIPIEASFSNPQLQPERMLVYFRQKGASNYERVDMLENIDSFTGVIPAARVIPPTIEYFVLAVFPQKIFLSNPTKNPMDNPHEIVVTGDAIKPRSIKSEKVKTEYFRKTQKGSICKITIMSPEPYSDVHEEDVLIAVAISEQQGNIASRMVRLFYNNNDVTTDAEISKYLVTYVPKKNRVGTHKVRIELSDDGGNRFQPVEWTYSVYGGVAKSELTSKSFSGRLYFDARNENISDSTLSTINSGVNFSGRLGAISYRASVFMTSHEDKNKQPRNRYLMEFGTSWLGVRLGDTNPLMNDLILWGKRVRGVEGYLNLGFFNVQIVQGEANRAVDGTLDSMAIDPVTNDTLRYFNYGTYKQNIFAVRPSFGGGKHFQLGFTYLKARDETKSIDIGRNPQDNIVIGTDIMFGFDSQRLVLKAGAAFSMISQDISGGAISKSEIDSVFETELPFDPAEFEDIFVLNTSTVPLDPRELTSLAYNAEFRMRYFRNSVEVRYKSIGSEFYSLGNTFLRNNTQGIFVSDRIRLPGNQFYLTLGYDQYLDGLANEQDDDPYTKPVEVQSYNIGVNYYPRSVFLPTVSVSIRDNNRNNGLDTLNAIENQAKDYSFQLGYNLELYNLANSFQFSIISSDRIDDINPMLANVTSDIQMLTIRTQYQIPLTTTITLASNNTNTGNALNKYSFEFNQFGIMADYRMLNNKMKLIAGINSLSGTGFRPINGAIEKYTDYDKVTLNMGVMYRITTRQYLNLDMYFISYEDKLSNSYNDNIMRFRYEYRL